MWIVAIAWIYVVALMAATEPSIVHGLMTFLCYCVLPLSIVFYLTGSKRRRARREARAVREGAARTGTADGTLAADNGADDGGGDGGGGGD